ncbi:MAG: hypothetical protein JXX28_06065 [Deltaproteobacteria bacterium]|nr:hypothetical protein [Deltaproteobacteria bacterium]
MAGPVAAHAAPSRFGFLVHPLTPLHRRVTGVRRGHWAMLRDGPAGIEAVGLLARLVIPTLMGPAEGFIVGVPDLGAQLAEGQERARVHRERAARIAEAHGAQVIGLGNALAVVAGRGQRLVEDTGLPITTGHAATAWSAVEITQLAAARHGAGPVGVLGFKGAVGDAVAEGLARRGRQVLVEDSGPRVRRRARELGLQAVGQEELLATSRYLVGASTTGPSLAPEALRSGTVLIDLSLPPTLSPGRLPRGVRLYAGETLSYPETIDTTDLWGAAWLAFAGYGKGVIYACLAEPAVLALAGLHEPRVGRRVSTAVVEQTGALLTQAGLRPALRPGRPARQTR